MKRIPSKVMEPNLRFGSDPQRPSTWVKYKKNMCDGCYSHCCQLPVEASAYDLIRLGLTNEEEAGLSLSTLAKRLKASKVIQHFQPKSQLFVLSQKANMDCQFLDQERLCTVYDKRPEVCRQFPKIGPSPGSCPHRPKTYRNVTK